LVEPEEASQVITQFLGGPFGTITTPPIDAYGDPLTLTVPTTVPTTAPPATTATTATTATSSTTATTVPPNPIPSYDPRPC
jgi:hypothetical protein